MKYINTVTGAKVDVSSKIRGNWVLLDEAPKANEEKKAETEKPVRKKRGTKSE